MPSDTPIPGSPADWLAYARRDLAIARVPLPEGGAYETLCFHAQQAAEKAIKAVYRARGLAFRYTHDLDYLLDGLRQQGVPIPDEVWEARDLTRYAWESRYPSFGEPVEQQEYEWAVALAEKVLKWAHGELAKGSA